jgi:hypothetical protein
MRGFSGRRAAIAHDARTAITLPRMTWPAETDWLSSSHSTSKANESSG